MKKKDPNADPDVPDSSDVRREGKEHINFDDAYIKGLTEKHDQPAIVVGEICEYCQPKLHALLIRECELFKGGCGEQGWRYHYRECELRARTLRAKEKLEKREGRSIC
jgi:hypothetical protein